MQEILAKRAVDKFALGPEMFGSDPVPVFTSITDPDTPGSVP